MIVKRGIVGIYWSAKIARFAMSSSAIDVSRRAVLAAACSLLLATPGAAATLQSLFGGGFLTVGNCRFDDWQLLTGSNTTGAALDYSQMSMNVLASDPNNPGLQFAAGGQLAVAGVNAVDLSFSFQVHSLAAGNSFTGHSLNMTGVSFAGPGGIAYLSQEATTLAGADLGPVVALADNVADVFEFADAQTFAPHHHLKITVNLFASGLEAGDSINFTAFTQRFAQIGPAELAGDFNGDKTVDGADFLRWQRGQSPQPLSQSDLTAWRNNYGQSIFATPAISAVPEPAGALLASLGLAAGARLGVKRRRDFIINCRMPS